MFYKYLTKKYRDEYNLCPVSCPGAPFLSRKRLTAGDASRRVTTMTANPVRRCRKGFLEKVVNDTARIAGNVTRTYEDLRNSGFKVQIKEGMKGTFFDIAVMG